MNSTGRLLAIIIFLLPAAVASAQTLQLGGGIGVISPGGDFGGNTMEYYDGNKYGLSTGLALQAKLRVGFGSFQLVGEIGYAMPRNSGEAEPGQGSVEVAQNIFSLRVGPEFHISIPAVPLTPYVGANIALNSFSGTTTFQGVSRVPSGDFDVEGASRFGAGFGGGVIISIASLKFDVNASYNLMNLTGQSFDTPTSGNVNRIDSYTYFNDAKDPGYAPGDNDRFIASDRTVNSVLVSLSVMLGL